MSAIACTLTGPSDYFNAWYDKNRPQHSCRRSNTTCHDLVKPIDGELETEKPQARLPQAEMIMEQCCQSCGRG
jgi:hypothetical protein